MLWLTVDEESGVPVKRRLGVGVGVEVGVGVGVGVGPGPGPGCLFKIFCFCDLFGNRFLLVEKSICRYT